SDGRIVSGETASWLWLCRWLRARYRLSRTCVGGWRTGWGRARQHAGGSSPRRCPRCRPASSTGHASGRLSGVASVAEWVAGARPRTLPAAVAPVAVGTGAAAAAGGAAPGRALLALVVALALQVGVNYANDYSDGIRGTDADRVGPFRLVGSGTAQSDAVRPSPVAGLVGCAR